VVIHIRLPVKSFFLSGAKNMTKKTKIKTITRKVDERDNYGLQKALNKCLFLYPQKILSISVTYEEIEK